MDATSEAWQRVKKRLLKTHEQQDKAGMRTYYRDGEICPLCVEELEAEVKQLTRALELVCTHKIHVRYGWNAAGNTYGYWAIYDTAIGSQWHGPFSTRVEAVLAAEAAEGEA